jgi:four helix bundle protein
MADDEKRTQSEELQERLIELAVRVIRLASSLPKTAAGQHIAGQILRSGTSPAPNYAEARGAESQADFTHKIGIVLKELNETVVWLRTIERSGLIKPELLQDLLQETQELTYIFAASAKTARANKR